MVMEGVMFSRYFRSRISNDLGETLWNTVG
jgi:hypothetical protein